MYCERCQTLYEDRCPFCKQTGGREAKPDDLCFLIEQDSLWTSILSDVLRQAGIPFTTRQSVGVVAYVGDNLARYRFYTPHAYYPRACKLTKNLLHPNESQPTLT